MDGTGAGCPDRRQAALLVSHLDRHISKIRSPEKKIEKPEHSVSSNIYRVARFDKDYFPTCGGIICVIDSGFIRLAHTGG